MKTVHGVLSLFLMAQENFVQGLQVIANASAHHISVISGKPEVHPIFS